MAVRAQSFPPSGSISGSYFSISSWFFKRDLSERNDNGLSMARNYATFLHNFLGIICIKTHGCKCTICCCAEAPWSDPLLKLPSVVTFPGMLPSRHLPTVIRVLIRWIKSKLCEARMCEFVWWLRLRIIGCAEGHLGLMAPEAASFFKVIQRRVLFAFVYLFLFIFFLKKREQMKWRWLCCHFRPNVTLTPSGRKRNCRSCGAERKLGFQLCFCLWNPQQTERQAMIPIFTSPYLLK